MLLIVVEAPVLQLFNHNRVVKINTVIKSVNVLVEIVLTGCKQVIYRQELF